MTQNPSYSTQELQAAHLELDRSGVVAFPTETVYGLGARVDRPEGLRKIFATKERPFFDPLIVHVDSVEMARRYSKGWNAICDLLSSKFWPGPLTLVTDKTDLIPDVVSSGLSTVGLRLPDTEEALALISTAGVGIAAPSANRFGRTSPTKAEHVFREYEGKVLVFGNRDCRIGIESSVLAVHGEELSLLRLGAVTKADVEKALQGSGLSFRWREAESLKGAQAAPGRMKHHYMPDVPLVLLEQGSTLGLDEVASILTSRQTELPREVEGVQLKSFGDFKKGVELLLSSDGSLAARELYAKLRESSQDLGADFLVLRLKPEMRGELWEAVLERLTKASSLTLS